MPARPVSAPLRERAPPPLGVSPARGPCLAAPHLGPMGPARIPRSLSSTSASSCVRAARLGPLLRPPTLSRDHHRGGRVPLPVTTPPHWGGTGGATWLPTGNCRVGPVLMGAEGDMSLPLVILDVLVVQHP